jgi:ribonuclease HI
MTTIRIVCDASYDDSLRLTGFAGYVEAMMPSGNPVYHAYQGVIGELEDNHLGELAAILVGVKRLSEKIKQGLVTPSEVHIYSDSQTIIDSFAHLQDPGAKIYPKHEAMLHELASWIKHLPCDTTFHHVHAHVPEQQASPIERLNNLADKRANDVRQTALQSMLSHNKNSPFVTLLAPDTPKNQGELRHWALLTEALLSQGKRIRLHVDTPLGRMKHPIMEAAHNYCHMHQLPVTDHVREYHYIPAHKPAGLDMTMLRYHVMQEGRDPNFSLTYSSSQKRAGFASSLLYGKPYSNVVPMRNPTGRIEAPSHAVLDLLRPTPTSGRRPNTVQGFVHTFLAYSPTPLYQGVESALTYANAAVPMNAPDNAASKPKQVSVTTTTDLENAISQTVNTYADTLDRRQLAVKLVDTLREHGYPCNSPFNDSMMRFVRANRPSAQSSFARRLLRHANKMQSCTTEHASKPTTAAPAQDNKRPPSTVKPA